MLFSDEDGLYKVSIINGGIYRVKKVVSLNGQQSNVAPGATYEGDKVVLDSSGCLVLYNGDVKIMETTRITNL